MKHVYVVDNSKFKIKLNSLLQQYSYVSTNFNNHNDMIDLLVKTQNKIDCIVFVGNENITDYVSIMREIRSVTQFPIVLVVPNGLPEIQTIICFEYIDDLVRLDVQSNEELIARISVLSRRKVINISDNRKRHIFQDGPILIGLEDYTIKIHGKLIKGLSNKPFLILKKLVINSPHPVTKSAIIDDVWGMDDSKQDANLRVNISKIRDLFRENGCGNRIKTKSTIGYSYIKMEDDEEEES